MTETRPPLTGEDYAAIEAAVMETSRGRWFLSEYARRNRQADTGVLLQALERIEGSIKSARFGDDVVRLRQDLADMVDGIARTKKDLASSVAEASGPSRPVSIERAFDDVIQAAEKADSDVFAAAEHVQEIAWSLREAGDSTQACSDLDRQALDIYRATNQHALTTNRVRAIIGVLRFIESRIHQMVGAWPGDMTLVDAVNDGVSSEPRRALLESAPPRIRDDIVFVERPEVGERPLVPRGPAPRPAAAASPAAAPSARPEPMAPRLPELPVDPRVAAFAAVDAMPAEEKLLLFA